jgi:hypothetical protein
MDMINFGGDNKLIYTKIWPRSKNKKERDLLQLTIL